MNNPLPTLANSQHTLESLRESLQVLRSVRSVSVEPITNQLEYSVFSRSYGASTGELNFGGELQLDYLKQELRYVKSEDTEFSVGLKGKSQTFLFNETIAKLSDYSKLTNLDRPRITEKNAFRIDSGVARNYSEIQHRTSTALSRVRSHMTGFQTAVALWPHGFDLSFLWFKNGSDEMKDSHMNFGFSPGLGEDEPYLYFYAWPTPKKMLAIELPHDGKWLSTWNAPGARFSFSKLREQNNPEEFIEKLFLGLYHQVLPLLEDEQSK